MTRVEVKKRIDDVEISLSEEAENPQAAMRTADELYQALRAAENTIKNPKIKSSPRIMPPGSKK
nr:hypothetical protein [uncultured Methanolobus sp.]